MLGRSTHTPNGRHLADIALTLAIVGTVGIMLVPLPTGALDLLIASNLGIAILIVMVAVYVPGGLGFTVFPTLLLLTTLYRLALNVSSTRLILVQADAGDIIDGFGHFVVMGSLTVGAVVFIVLTLIQFVVITRGAERIAEVGARFTLDALPGKQLSIDAERRSGALTSAEAGRRRQRLETESQFYGAMDGAMKFVKGDAIAGLIITGLNLIAGTAVGVVRDEQPIGEALHTYGLLTIGDGLVSQVPALLISVSAGLVVTRVATGADHPSLARAIFSQVFGQPKAMFAAALFLIALGLMPGLPTLPFMLLGFGLALVGWRSLRVDRRLNEQALSRAPQPSLLTLELNLKDYETLSARDRPLARVFRKVHDELICAMGVPLPPPRVRADSSLPAHAFRFRFQELPDPTCHLQPGDDLVHAIGETLSMSARRRAAELLRVQDVQELLDNANTYEPALVTAAVGAVSNIVTMTQVLRQLLREGVSLRPFSLILESFANQHGEGLTPAQRVTRARRAMGAHLVLPHLDSEGVLQHFTLSPYIEDELKSCCLTSGELTLAPRLWEELVGRLRSAHRAHPQAVLMVEGVIRAKLWRATAPELAPLTVLAWDELPDGIPVRHAQEISA